MELLILLRNNMDDISKFLDSQRGRQMKDYLSTKLMELRDIENVKEKDTSSRQVIEIKAQRRAYLKLKEILAELMTFEQKTKPKDSRDSFIV